MGYAELLANVPEELRAFDHWCGWLPGPALEGKKPAKVPSSYNPRYAGYSTGNNDGYHKKGSSTDPGTWTSFTRVVEITDHVMFALSPYDPYLVVDLDYLDLDHPITQEILGKFHGAYVEWSPSGQGIHLWVKAPLQRKRQLKGIDASGNHFGIDIMSVDHFMTVTGNVITPVHAIPDGSAAVEWLIAAYGPKQAETHGHSTDSLYNAEITADQISLQDIPYASRPAGLDALLAADRAFYQTWHRERKMPSDDSPSGYMQSLANQLVAAGWPHQDIYAALVWWREWINADPKGVAAFKHTIAKAQNAFNKRRAQQKLDDLASSNPHETKAVMYQLTGLALGTYIQTAHDPATYRIVLTDSADTVLLGLAADVRNQETWRSIAQERTGAPFVKMDSPMWQQFLLALGKVVTREDPEVNTTFEGYKNVLGRYAKQASLHLSAETMESDTPVLWDGKLYLSLTHLWLWLQQVGKGEAESRLRGALRSLGAAPEIVTRPKPGGGSMIREYWVMAWGLSQPASSSPLPV